MEVHGLLSVDQCSVYTCIKYHKCNVFWCFGNISISDWKVLHKNGAQARCDADKVGRGSIGRICSRTVYSTSSCGVDIRIQMHRI